MIFFGTILQVATKSFNIDDVLYYEPAVVHVQHFYCLKLLKTCANCRVVLGTLREFLTNLLNLPAENSNLVEKSSPPSRDRCADFSFGKKESSPTVAKKSQFFLDSENQQKSVEENVCEDEERRKEQQECLRLLSSLPEELLNAPLDSVGCQGSLQEKQWKDVDWGDATETESFKNFSTNF